jgi:hypothetical protein
MYGYYGYGSALVSAGIEIGNERRRANRAESAAHDASEAASMYSAAARGHAAACGDLRMRALIAEADRDIARETIGDLKATIEALRGQLSLALQGAGILFEEIAELKARVH